LAENPRKPQDSGENLRFWPETPENRRIQAKICAFGRNEIVTNWDFQRDEGSVTLLS
jgi:hypothetical protein